ncbi:MAG: DUF4339 domain-containing protein [Chthoniobacterales bacterium]
MLSDEWFVRVQGKEYGPVDLETLREWQADGRVVPQNELRRADETDWILAGAVAELYPPPPLPTIDARYLAPRTFAQILLDTFRLYARGFPQLFGLSLLVALPSLGFQLCMLFVDTTAAPALNPTSRFAAGGVVLFFLVLVAVWPLYLTGIQLAVADLAASRVIRFGNLLRRARERWRPMARLCLFVYGSFLFWTALPLIAVGLVAASPSVLSFLLAVGALTFQVYMAGRLFVNFLFWQQTAVIAGEEGVEALRSSQELARSGRDRPWLERPLYRGAILASLWLLVLIVVAVGLEFPVVLWRLHGATDLNSAVTLMDTLIKNPPIDGLNLASYLASSLANALLHPLLGIAFVLLYFDARARNSRDN